MRTRAKVDSNQKAIVAALRAHGASVEHIHAIGKGCPDILVGFRGKNFLMELKDGSLSPSKRKLTPDEIDWHRRWAGEVYVVESADEALIAIGVSFKNLQTDSARKDRLDTIVAGRTPKYF